jgi:hypothetical protein
LLRIGRASRSWTCRSAKGIRDHKSRRAARAAPEALTGRPASAPHGPGQAINMAEKKITHCPMTPANRKACPRTGRYNFGRMRVQPLPLSPPDPWAIHLQCCSRSSLHNRSREADRRYVTYQWVGTP